MIAAVEKAGRRPRSSWPEERTDRLKELFGKGISYPLIAKEMETTKGVVVGKLARLGLGREKEAQTGGAPRASKPRPKPAPAAPEGDMRLVRLEDLAAGECKWPAAQDGEGVWLFCGLPADGIYCAHHHRRAYKPAAPVNLDDLLRFR